MTSPGSALRVTLYERKGCHLCEVALIQLRALTMMFPFQIDRVNIEGDEELERRFMLEIPVIEINGKIVAQGSIDFAAVRQAVIAGRLGNTIGYQPEE